MIPHNPNVVVASWSPFAHWASTRHVQNLASLGEKDAYFCLCIPVQLWLHAAAASGLLGWAEVVEEGTGVVLLVVLLGWAAGGTESSA